MVGERVKQLAAGVGFRTWCLAFMQIRGEQLRWGAARLRCRRADAEYGTEVDGANLWKCDRMRAS